MVVHIYRTRRKSGIPQATVIWEDLELEGQTICPGVGHMGVLKHPF